LAVAAGCVSSLRGQRFETQQAERRRVEELLGNSYSGANLAAAGLPVPADGVSRTLAEWLRFPFMDVSALCAVEPLFNSVSRGTLDTAIQDHRYAPYLARQAAEIARLHRDEAVSLPVDLEFERIAGLSNEMVEKLKASRPSTLGAASRIRGITPAALAAILVHARRKAA
jgi:tRNA uridine 5-carboxymethylaminomethyl modification enzyme